MLIPAYEPAEHLPRLVAELIASGSDCGCTGSAGLGSAGLGTARLGSARTDADALPVRVIVVDDGSGPEYAGVFARSAAAGAEVLRHDRNRGKGAALRTGFRRALDAHPGEGVVTADADGQHTAADILAVAAEVREGGERDGAEMVLGCRGFDGDVPLRSRFGNDVSRRLFRVAAGWSLSDTQTGLRGIPAAMLPWLLEVPGDRFEYEQRVLLGLRRAGFSARERRIETVYLAGNESSHFRPVLDSVRVLLPVVAFAASSLLGFVIDAVALFVLETVTGALVPSIVAARVLSASVNFWVNRRVVFMRRGREGLVRQAVSYALLAGVMLASNIVWMSYLTGIGVPLWCAKLVTELVLFLTSYRVQKSSVFAATERPRRSLFPATGGAARIGA